MGELRTWREGSSAACVCAVVMLDPEASMASVLAPNRVNDCNTGKDCQHVSTSLGEKQEAARTSAKIPPPQPTSSTSLPASHLAPSSSSARRSSPRTKSMRAGFMRCRRPNSPVGSHQSAERREKCSISACEIVLVPLALPLPGAGGADERPCE